MALDEKQATPLNSNSSLYKTIHRYKHYAKSFLRSSLSLAQTIQDMTTTELSWSTTKDCLALLIADARAITLIAETLATPQTLHLAAHVGLNVSLIVQNI
jgi:hypothetical protein